MLTTRLATSLAQDHFDSVNAAVAASRRARQARLSRRTQRRAARHHVTDATGC